MINSVKTDRSLRYRVYHENGELIARTFYIENAAVLVGLCGIGATIKCCQRTVWTQGVDGDASDNVDEVAYAEKVRFGKTSAEQATEGLRTLGKAADAAGISVQDLTPKDSAFDFSCATNLYLVAARELGTELYGTSLTDLLVEHTDWNRVKCKRLAKRVLDDPALVKLLDDEGISKWINANA